MNGLIAVLGVLAIVCFIVALSPDKEEQHYISLFPDDTQ